MDPEAGRTIEVAALGRPFSLGMLYDCRRDSLVPGLKLWDLSDLEKDQREQPQPNSDFEIVASESIDDKSSALNVEASLKASFLGGLVKVGGSAKYLNDQKASKHQARVTLKFKTTTKFQELSMNHLGSKNVKHTDVFKKGLATHVVTGVLYGAQAFFVFDCDKSDNQSQQDIQGNLEVMIKKIPCISIEGKGKLSIKEEDVKKVEKFSCKFHGDFLLKKTPTTFQDAVEVYQSLPGLLGAKGENAVPMKVWLYPLTNLDSKAAKLVRQISVGLVQDAQRVLEDLSELEMRCNDALKTTAAQQFPQIVKKIKRFKEMCGQFKDKFIVNLSTKLPSIRGGGEEEAVLAEILEKRISSPFNSNSLNEWLDCKEREIDTVMSFTKMMKSTKFTTSQNHLYKEVLSVEHAVCFVFTSLGEDEPYLSALSNYLKGTEPEDPQDPQSDDVEKEQWYASKEVMDAMRTKAKLFSDFAEANKENKNIKFLTVGLTDETHKASTIYLYKGGCHTVGENFEPPSKPESVTAAHINPGSVTLKISPPRYGAENITSYSAEFCVSGEDEWKQKEGKEAGEVTVHGLRPNTEYVFRCRAVTPLGVGPFVVSDPIKTSEQLSDPIKASEQLSDPIKTSKRLSDAVREKSKKLKPQAGPLPAYLLPLKEKEINIKGCRCFSFGKESRKPNRTIMVLGATGAGKSTLINGMINHILGVEWNDSYRFVLVNEDQSKSRAHSQTSEVTVYKINHKKGFRINSSLTIVDTPGFGDTRGIERDREIIEQLRNLFSTQLGVSEIDAVCVVAQASSARLTPTQKYVFDSVLSIFGKDVAENIRILVTFADGQPPPVLEAIRESGVPCPKGEDGLPLHFKFNNSALFADNRSAAAGSMSGDGNFYLMFWNMGTKSMKTFFAALNQMETKSLTLTKQVLRERKQLEVSVESLQKQVRLGLAKLEEIKETSEKLREHEAEISRNENFEFEVSVMKPFQHDISGTGNYITNCQNCNFTCHYPCSRSNDADKRRCAAMKKGYCTACPNKCSWNVHFNQKYRWEYKEVKEKVTKKDLEEKYKKASGEKMTVQQVMGKLEAEYNDLQLEVVKLMEKSAECLNRLQEIALKPNPLSTPEYIDLLIKGEKSEAKPGWNKRVESLMKMKETAEFMMKVEKGENPLQRSSMGLQQCNPTERKKKAVNSDVRTKIRPKVIQANAEAETDTNQDQSQINTGNTDQDEAKSDSDKD
ncbi:uncharacterized protein PAE49_015527 [Odontesthes bonariensis]|uniref:uncharacterized protein LOC142398581 n=1 Tax=Odontesthes bonariensis TaxID=219752 RepID=UPI003F58A280